MSMGVSYKLSELIKDSIRKRKRSDNVNDLLIDILEKEVEWQHENHDPLTQFKKTYKKLIEEYYPYKEGAN